MDAPSRVSVRDTLAQQLCSVFHRAHMSSYIYRTEGPQFRFAFSLALVEGPGVGEHQVIEFIEVVCDFALLQGNPFNQTAWLLGSGTRIGHNAGKRRTRTFMRPYLGTTGSTMCDGWARSW
jgi:hypothetical protein